MPDFSLEVPIRRISAQRIHLRVLDRRLRRDEALAAALLDMWWPAILVTRQQARPMGSITYNASFYLPAEPLKTDYALLTTQSSVTEQGYAQERDMLWTRDGHLIAMAEQQILVIK